MSRIGKVPVNVPDGVTVELAGQELSVKGPKGALSAAIHDEVAVKIGNGQVTVSPRNDSKVARAMWGMNRTIVSNLVEGVTKGFEKKLLISGVGYRAQMKGNAVNLQLGFSHEVDYPVPEGIKVECPDQTTVVISGIDKQKVGQVAAEIRAYRKPEPYKGKGVRYDGEYIFRKEGKKK